MPVTKITWPSKTASVAWALRLWCCRRTHLCWSLGWCFLGPTSVWNSSDSIIILISWMFYRIWLLPWSYLPENISFLVSKSASVTSNIFLWPVCGKLNLKKSQANLFLKNVASSIKETHEPFLFKISYRWKFFELNWDFCSLTVVMILFSELFRNCWWPLSLF